MKKYFENHLSLKSQKQLARTSTSNKFNEMYILWIKNKYSELKPDVHFCESINGNNYIQPCVKNDDESISLIPFKLLIEYAKYISDINYFVEKMTFCQI